MMVNKPDKPKTRKQASDNVHLVRPSIREPKPDGRSLTMQGINQLPGEKIINALFSLCTNPEFTYAAWQCSQSESPDIVGLIDMPQFQTTVGQILALIPDVAEIIRVLEMMINEPHEAHELELALIRYIKALKARFGGK